MQTPDLIGVKDRKYLDRTGLQQHRGLEDMMRYAALNQRGDYLSRFGDFTLGRDGGLPDPESESRYGDDQLYALVLYVYSLQPPENPNKPGTLPETGRKVFEREVCGSCHPAPPYTNNRLTPVAGFQVPKEHRRKYDILEVSVGTDPTLALATRRGTGYYKVPSLKGVWYRGPFEHNGSVATLEGWFDARRLRDDYVPTGWVGPGVRTRAVRGHEFGLKLPAEEEGADCLSENAVARNSFFCASALAHVKIDQCSEKRRSNSTPGGMSAEC